MSAPIRELAKEHLTRTGQSQRTLAKAIGMTDGAVSAWLAGKYEGNNEGVENAVSAWLETEKARAKTPRKPEFIAELAATRQMMEVFGLAHAGGEMALIYGESGIGKSFAAQAYAAAHPGTIYLVLDPTSGMVRSFVGSLLRAATRKSMSNNEPTSVAVDGIIESLQHSRRLLIIDEAQHMEMRAVETLRRIYDQAGIGIVLVGHSSLYTKLLGQNKSLYAQTYSRIAFHRGFSAHVDRQAITHVYKAIIGQDPSAACVAHLERLGSQPGTLRTIVKTLILAGTVALAEDRNIEMRDLKWADTHRMGREVA